MANLLTQHKVEDYAAWRPYFDRHEEARVAAGITNPRVYRNADDPNYLGLVSMWLTSTAPRSLVSRKTCARRWNERG